MTNLTIPIGPQHPLLKEPISLKIDIAGEAVLGGSLRLGYVHRGIEKLAQSRNYHQNIPLMERVCGICSHIHTTTYCYAVENLLGVDIPIRAKYIRALLCELERVHSHLLWLGVLAKHIGLDTIFMHTWHDRELILDLMENLSGGRVSHGVNQIGGVRFDISPEQEMYIEKTLQKLQTQVKNLIHIVEAESSIKARTQGVAIITPQQVAKYCLVGPVARASGVDIDLRRDAPFAPYNMLPFNVITHNDGDAWARTYVRIQEVEESMQLCRNIMMQMPDGPVSVKTRHKVPAGETTMRLEAPRGEVFYYIRSDGSESPERLKIRTPTLPVLGILTEQLSQIQVADITVVLAGVDLCIACADR